MMSSTLVKDTVVPQESRKARVVQDVLSAFHAKRSAMTLQLSEHGRKMERVSQELSQVIRRTDRILTQLLEERALTTEEYDEIHAQSTVYKLTRHLTVVIGAKPVTAYECFIKALYKTNQEHLRQLIEQGCNYVSDGWLCAGKPLNIIWCPGHDVHLVFTGDVNVEHKEVLIDNFNYLKTNLDVTRTALLDYLLTDGVLYPEEKEEVQVQQTQYRKVDKLLQFIRRSSHEQFECFLTALEKCDFQYIADVLREGLDKHRKITPQPVETLDEIDGTVDESPKKKHMVAESISDVSPQFGLWICKLCSWGTEDEPWTDGYIELINQETHERIQHTTFDSHDLMKYRGIHTTLFNPSTCINYGLRSFDTFGSSNDAKAFQQYLSEQPKGMIVFGVTGESVTDPRHKWNPQVPHIDAAMEIMGWYGINIGNYRNRDKFIFAIQIGYPDKTLFILKDRATSSLAVTVRLEGTTVENVDFIKDSEWYDFSDHGLGWKRKAAEPLSNVSPQFGQWICELCSWGMEDDPKTNGFIKLINQEMCHTVIHSTFDCSEPTKFRGIHTLLFDPSTCKSHGLRSFDTYANSNDAKAFQQYLSEQPKGIIVLGVTGDSVTDSHNKWNAQIRHIDAAMPIMISYGIRLDGYQNRDKFVFVIQIGYPDKSLFEFKKRAQCSLGITVCFDGTTVDNINFKKESEWEPSID